MKKTILTAAFSLVVLTGVNGHAQKIGTSENQKPPVSTVDAWRGSVPAEAEQSPNSQLLVIAEESTNNVETRETAAEIEKRVLDLQIKLMEALKLRDSVALGYLLADDFVPTGANLTDAQADKPRYIQWALKNSEIKSYTLEKTTVRSYRTAAVVTARYKQQAVVAGVPSSSEFISTNVWVKRGKQWQAVSHHISQIPAPKP